MIDSNAIRVIANFTEENFTKFCEAIPANESENMFSYDAFLPTVEAHREQAVKDGWKPWVMNIDVDHFIEWCESNKKDVNRNSLSEYTLRVTNE